MEYILLKASVDYADEFNCDMFSVVDKSKWDGYKEKVKLAFKAREDRILGENKDKEFKYPWQKTRLLELEISFGTNECLKVSNVDEWIRNIKEIEISADEAKVLSRVFDKEIPFDFGTGSGYFNVLRYID